jgi:ubiquinone/menaquinone biosynthesis C-methylase UbiE
MADKLYTDNEEAAEAWNGVLFDRFKQYRQIFVGGLAQHGDAAIDHSPPAPGDRILDIGCGFGDTTRQLAALAGDRGNALGVDVAERFIEAAREEAALARAGNVAFAIVDVEQGVPEGPFDYAFSRMGTMFFANPVQALRNVRQALAPGGRLCMVVWRQKVENAWAHRAEQIVERWLENPDPDDSDEPTCGPGPFSMANADTTSGILKAAGFTDISLCRCDRPMLLGADIDEAVNVAMALGPAAEIIRLAGDEAERLHPEIGQALREGLSEFETPSGVFGDSSTWICCARNPL